MELFFKWIKQHLRIKQFYGTSENAVKTQIWIAVSVYVLVAIVKKRLDLDASLYTLLQILSVTLFEKMPIHQALALLATLFGLFPFLGKLFADSAYQGPVFHRALAGILPDLETEIVKRSDRVKGFVVQPRRWVVERTIAWLNRCRRLAKDWENLNRNALAFIKLASIRLMLRKLCNPT